MTAEEYIGDLKSRIKVEPSEKENFFRLKYGDNYKQLIISNRDYMNQFLLNPLLQVLDKKEKEKLSTTIVDAVPLDKIRAYGIKVNTEEYTYRMKATISGGVLTVTEDGSQSADMAIEPYFLQVALSDSVLNGEEGLVIEFNTGAAYGWYEVTELHACSGDYAMKDGTVMTTADAVASCDRNENSPSETNMPTSSGSTGAANWSETYDTYNYVQSENIEDGTSATFTLNAFNYNAYDEVYFGVAFAATTPVATADSVLTIGGASLTVPETLIGNWYFMKAVVKGGYLTLVNDGSTFALNSDTNYKAYGCFLRVALSEEVLNGEEGLVINFTTGTSYYRIEVTNLVAVRSSAVSYTENVASLNKDTGSGEKNIPLNANGTFKGSVKYETYSYVTTKNNNALNASISMAAFDYTVYDEVRFGVAFAVTGESGSITIAGETYNVQSIGAWYQLEAVIKDGYLTLMDSSSTVYLKVALSESVLNGTEGFVIGFEAAAGYAWCEVSNTLAYADVSFVS